MMRNCRLCVAALIGFVLAATAAWASPAGEEAAAASDKPMVTDPTTGKMVTAPEYGGTLTYPYKLFGPTVDPSITGNYAGWQNRRGQREARAGRLGPSQGTRQASPGGTSRPRLCAVAWPRAGSSRTTGR